MKIALITVTVNGTIAAFTFYTEILELKEKMFMPETRRAVVVLASVPDGRHWCSSRTKS